MTRQDSILAEPNILALDSSSKATSMAVARGGTLLGFMGEAANQRRSETLWTEAAALLAGTGMTIADVDVFAVCVGPGGFTGLRVGIAAFKGFAAAANKPIIGVTSLEAAAVSAGPSLTVCALVNAYKSEVYSQLFSVSRDGVAVAQNEPIASTPEEALDRVAGLKELVFAGDGAEAAAGTIKRFAGSGGESSGGDRRWSIRRSERGLAEDIARLALLRYARGEMETAESLKACYVRRAEAEIKLSLGLLGSKIKRSMKQG